MSIDTSVEFKAMINVKGQWQPLSQICNLEPPAFETSGDFKRVAADSDCDDDDDSSDDDDLCYRIDI